MASYVAGDKVSNRSAFTSPIGTYFPAGTIFTVEIGGESGGRSIKLRSDRCGSVAWISDGWFLTMEDR
jgi:hypothetical protein